MAFVEKLVCAPAPFQSPITGLGSSVAETPKSSAMRYSSHRAIHSWSDTSSGASGPTWNSHWPGLVGARAVEAPDGQVARLGHGLAGQHLGLRAQLGGRLGAVDPDVLRLVGHWVPSVECGQQFPEASGDAVAGLLPICERSMKR